MKSQKKLGEKFLAWLERQGEAANSARMTQQALSLAKQATAQKFVLRCLLCGKAGQKVENCTGTASYNQISRMTLGGEPGQEGRSRSPDHIPRQEWAQKLLREEGSKEIRLTAEARIGPCPACREKHVYP